MIDVAKPSQAELLSQVVQSPIKVTQNKREF